MSRTARIALVGVCLLVLTACGRSDDDGGSSAGEIDLASEDVSLTITMPGGSIGQAWPHTIALGDFNGDGEGDMMIGAPLADGPGGARQDAGEAYVLFGPVGETVDLSSPDAASAVVLGAEIGDNFGGGMAAGDVNGDGIDDMIIGAPGSNGLVDIRTDMGEAYVIFGREGLSGTIDILEQQQDVTLQPAEGYSTLGKAFAVGDVNGDGVDDIVAGAPYAGRQPNTPPGGLRTTTGEVYVVFGGGDLGGIITVARDEDDLRLVGDHQYDQFGGDLTLADLNGDDLLDIVVGASGYDGDTAASEAGGVFVFFSAADAPRTRGESDADITISGPAGFGLGTAVAPTDLNGDGVPELAMSAPAAPGEASPEPGVGRLYYVHDLTSGAALDVSSCNCATIFYGAAPGEFFPASVAASADGRLLMLGSPLASPTERAGGGIAYLLRSGDGTTLPTASDLRVLGARAGDGLGGGLAFADLDGDGGPELIALSATADASRATIVGVSLGD